MNWMSALGALIIGLTPAVCHDAVDPIARGTPANVEILADLATADIVYLGETHDSVADHAAQLEIVTALYQDDPKLAIGMEMFQRPFQTAIDAYIAGEIDETELQARTEYADRWGFPWEYYAPLLRFARDRGLPVLALNAPAEATRKVSREGLASLTPEDRKYLPPLTEIDTSNRAHQDWVRDIFAQFDFHPEAAEFERFYAAQVLWDETMADTVANFVREQPEYRVVVIAGRGHTVYGYGIPSRVARRLPDRATLKQRSAIFSDGPDDADLAAELQAEPPIADHLWIHP